jgi:iron complex transport system substrate-binding protein
MALQWKPWRRPTGAWSEATVRICSLLPSTTEIVYALGLGDALVAVTHECDFPPEAAHKPRITHTAVESQALRSREIDALVAGHLHDHRGLYQLDRELLERLDPDLILTQELCDVCAVSYEEVQAAVRAVFGERTILSLEPTRLADVGASVIRIGTVTGRPSQAAAVASGMDRAITEVKAAVAGASERPGVVVLEWLDPPWVGGHWVPEMVTLAGGRDLLGEAGSPSERVEWEQVLEARPDMIVLAPCGFDVERTLAELREARLPDGWSELPAVRNGRVYAVNANAYFSRPGPRLADGLRVLAHLLHPELVAPPGVEAAWRMALGPQGGVR